MAHDPLVPSFTIGGIPVSATDMAGLAEAVRRRLAAGPAQPGTFVVFRDAHGVVRAQKDAALRAAHHDALLVVADGRPLSWIGRWRGLTAMQQVPGIESVEALCRAGVDQGWRHYFLGGGDGVADLLATTMRARVPGLQVAGVETPPFRPLDDAETEAMRARIRASGAQIVWVGLGTPKQEMFMAVHAPHLPGTIAMGVGAAFDVATGRIPRAPRRLQVAGLEWAYRLAREPRRLWRRYLDTIPRFLLIAARDSLSARKAPQPSTTGASGRTGSSAA
ncbi:N-acetylglucosaminyldiphosphoundecaprenol N-acetyl-beta-D-mannosaminyltransferase [Methylobacterium sp. 174MFSha1.1]|uniref:WecB/TagA/CpsF family glycosyltransferase n=1 Tax=Methylobacterium sp. 174MFSha1.1 TaxID=1502749 RepID=UPI0008E1C482|nr:WecB/TagA/CpsF family glycosyltransferase [Methylobacterium sp. 174MFSha1.1]SFV10371.1 N-acetylglucosaminyldiphosphoundecaprenol N-acetyl-beta-D-mannosaminyltransferase [Methylobacterium sp. 174MFSha1.1]